MKKLTENQKRKVKKFIKNLREIHLDDDTLDRMEGLTNQKMLETLNKTIFDLADDLMNEAFEPAEVKEYINKLVQKTLRKII